jgi:hypothetical protein
MSFTAEEHLLKPLDVVSEPKSAEEEGGLTGDNLTKESQKRKNPFKSRKTV